MAAATATTNGHVSQTLLLYKRHKLIESHRPCVLYIVITSHPLPHSPHRVLPVGEQPRLEAQAASVARWPASA